MKRSMIPISLLLPCLALLAGCGGKYHGSSTSNPSVSPFAGPYTGTYEAPFLEDTGTFNLTVLDSGQITGTGTSDTAGTGTLTGTISSAGVVSASLRFSSNTTATLNGQVTQQSNGNLTGTLTEVFQGQTGNVTVTLTPSPTTN